MKKRTFLVSATLVAFQLCAFESKRPPEADRLFRSESVEAKIVEVQKALGDTKLAWLFGNCFPNTLDTTVHYSKTADGDDDTFVYTGDIHAMWLRDSAAQVWPYLRFVSRDEPLRRLVRGVVLRQFACIRFDPYANAFNRNREGGDWQSDATDMKPELHERKYELDSLCYPLRLAYGYWKASGDATIFDDRWLKTLDTILGVMREQQRKNGVKTSYRFQRKAFQPTDSLPNYGYGWPTKACGLIASAFRPSDDATTYPFLIPSNFFAVDVLRKAAEILRAVNHDERRAGECVALADEVEKAIYEHAVFVHPKYGKVFAFEVDGFGNALFIDDSNVPSLLALPYFTEVRKDDPIYLNTRRLVWGEDNPYYFNGKAGAGVGGPHCGLDRVWPMSYVVRALTATSDAEVRECMDMIVKSDAGTGFMHESYDKDDPSQFTRAWFAWANTLFGELVLDLYESGKLTKTIKDIPYSKDGGKDGDPRRMDVQFPVAATGFPTVVWFHGGGLTGGRRHFVPFEDSSIAQVAVGYRLLNPAKGVGGEDCIRDAAEAVAWTLRHIAEHGGDPKKVFVAGHSAGGYLALMVGMDPKWLKAHGLSNTALAGIAPVSGQATKHFAVRSSSGDKDAQFIPKIDALAPLAHVSANLPPILSICGEPPREWKCRAEENRLLISSCTALGHRRARYVQLKGCNHQEAYPAGIPYVERFIKGE